MTSLTIVSINARRAIRYGVYFFIVFFIVRFTVQSAIALYRKFFPPAPPPPNIAFGKLPTLPFPIKPNLTNISYKLETPDGSLPRLTEQLPVFQMPPFSPKIKAFTDAKEKAENLGFNTDVQSIDENIPNVFLFKKKGSSTVLTMNIISGSFSISYDLTSDTSALNTKPPSESSALETVISYLESAELMPIDLTGETNTQLLRVESGTLKQAISLSEANFVKVNLFRKEISFRENTYKSVTPDFPESNVWFITNGPAMVLAEYHYFPVDETKSSTYPLKTSDLLWEELLGGKAYIANAGTNQSGEITIRRVYLAYYDPGQYTPFYQPVAVFEGDNGFYAYLPAVTDEYYGAN